MIQLVYRNGKYYTRINHYYYDKQTKDTIKEFCIKIDNSLIPKDFNLPDSVDIDAFNEYYIDEQFAYSSEYWLDISKIESIYGSDTSPWGVYYCYYDWILVFLEFSETEKRMFNTKIHREIKHLDLEQNFREYLELEQSFEELALKYKNIRPSQY